MTGFMYIRLSNCPCFYIIALDLSVFKNMKHYGYGVPRPMPFHSFLGEGYSLTNFDMNYLCECFIFLLVLYTIFVGAYGHTRVNISKSKIAALRKVCL